MQPRCSCTPLIVRGGFALVLALLVAALAGAQPTAVRFQPPKKEPDKKEPDKKEPTGPEIKWPTDVGGKDIHALMKEAEDPDPNVREFAVRLLPAFGPPAQEKDVSKLLLRRMSVEDDPGVRGAVFDVVGQIQFKDEAHNQEALRMLERAVDTGYPSSAARLHAVQAIARFGAKGEGAITTLTGVAMRDPSYEVRRNLAVALGRVGFNEKTGPNMKALTALADKLANDKCAAVRLEAMQSLMLIGPPWAGVMAAGAKAPPPINAKSAAVIVKYMRVRVGDPKAKSPPLEKDRQVEIWARLVLMRFDPNEVNDENLDALAKYLTGSEPAVKVQAMNAMVLLGELAARKLDDVVRVMQEEKAPVEQVAACLQVMAAMGAGAKPALPKLRTLLEEKKKGLAAKELELAKKKDDVKLTSEKYALDGLVKLLEKVIKHVEEAKPTHPPAAKDKDKEANKP